MRTSPHAAVVYLPFSLGGFKSDDADRVFLAVLEPIYHHFV
jgi:hypothetical protein